jgi:putative flippase GtrA
MVSLVTQLACNALVVKVIASVIVIVLNYVVSKYWVFGK